MMGGTTGNSSVVGEIKAVETPPAVAKMAAPAQAQSNVQKTHLANVETKEEVKAEDRWDDLLQKHFGKNWRDAKRVMMCESTGRSEAVGPTDSQGYNPIGLMQIKNFPGRPSTEELKVGELNIAYAASMFRDQGWGPWECAMKLGIH